MKKAIAIFLGYSFILLLFISNYHFQIEQYTNIQYYDQPVDEHFTNDNYNEFIIANPNSDNATSRAINPPSVITLKPGEITNTSAKLRGQLVATGGEDCSVWFEWHDRELEECAGMIATGSVCKDGRSIILKNRHFFEDNQKPRFFQGTKYSYFGVGSTNSMCRMGQNEKGLAIANFDVGGTLNNWDFTSDGSSGSEDNDLHAPLGNYSKVSQAALWIALHGFHPGQNIIISSEPGVGAIVAVDSNSHSKITWVNNSYAGIANAFYSDGAHDSDGNDVRVQVILDDIVNNGTSSEGNNKITWRDVAQRIAKDTNDKEDGAGIFNYASEISRDSSRAAMVALAGESALEGSLFMSWLNFAPTTQVGIFLPMYAGSLNSPSDIPSNFSSDNFGNGIYPYGKVKHDYASESCPVDSYQCQRVREIQKYANYNENYTFNEFDALIDTIISIGDSDIARTKLAEYVDYTLPLALRGYINNRTKMSNETNKRYPQGTGIFEETITGLIPGKLYHAKAWASNSIYSANGSQIMFLTKPDKPWHASAVTISQHQIELHWTRGFGATNTVIERSTSSAPWSMGGGILVYNGSNSIFLDTDLNAGTQYYYQLWSFTSLEGLHQYSSSFTIAINMTRYGNRPPIITTPPVATATEDAPYFVLYEYIDHDGDTITWSLATNASWLELAGNNLSGMPGDFDNGPYYVNVSCNDNNGSVVYSNFTLLINPMPDAPIITSRINDIELDEDGYYLFNLTGKGRDVDGDRLSWHFEDLDDELVNITVIDGNTLNISGRPNKYGNITVKLWLVENSENKLKTYQRLWINITPINDRPYEPFFIFLIYDIDPTVPGFQNLFVEFTARPPIDFDGEVNFTYAWDFDGDGIFDATGLNLLKINYTYSGSGVYIANLSVTDSGGLSNWANITVNISSPTNFKNDTDDGGKTDDRSFLRSWAFYGVIISVVIIIIIIILFLFKKKRGKPAP